MYTVRYVKPHVLLHRPAIHSSPRLFFKLYFGLFLLFLFVFLGYWYVQFQQPSPVFLLFVHSQKVVSPDWEVTIVIRCVRERTTWTNRWQMKHVCTVPTEWYALAKRPASNNQLPLLLLSPWKEPVPLTDRWALQIERRQWDWRLSLIARGTRTVCLWGGERKAFFFFFFFQMKQTNGKNWRRDKLEIQFCFPWAVDI